MGIRNQWISKPSTPGRLAELMVRSILAVIVYVIMLFALLVWAGATTDWFTGVGLLAPFAWLMVYILPNEGCAQS